MKRERQGERALRAPERERVFFFCRAAPRQRKRDRAVFFLSLRFPLSLYIFPSQNTKHKDECPPRRCPPRLLLRPDPVARCARRRRRPRPRPRRLPRRFSFTEQQRHGERRRSERRWEWQRRRRGSLSASSSRGLDRRRPRGSSLLPLPGLPHWRRLRRDRQPRRGDQPEDAAGAATDGGAAERGGGLQGDDWEHQ